MGRGSLLTRYMSGWTHTANAATMMGPKVPESVGMAHCGVKRGWNRPLSQRRNDQMKKSKLSAVLAVLVAGAMAVSMAGCGSSGTSTASAESAVSAAEDAESIEEEAADGEQEEAALSEAENAAETEEAASETADVGEDDTENGSDAFSEGENAAAITITDMTGREISLEEPATRIVALSPADCEILYAIGGGDTLVGRGEYCDYPAEVMDVPAVQSGADTNIEQIIALEPQVLLMSTMAQTTEQVEQLEEAGIHVVVSDAQDIEGVYTSVRMIGALMGKDEAAEEVVSGMQDRLAELASHASENEGKTIYFEVSPLEYGLWSAGRGTFMNEVAELLGLTNIFADVEGWAEVSEEEVIARNPDYIMTITMYFGEGPTPEEEIASRAGWDAITAVQNGAILDLPNNELSRPVPRLVDGAEMLEEFVSGDAAEEVADAA